MDSLNTYRMLREQKRRILFALGLLLFAVFPTLQSSLLESRFYRDMMHLTAFRDATVKGVLTEADGSILVWGTLIKRRCAFLDAVAYTTRGDTSELARLEFNPTGAEPPVINRPPLPLPQGWGPWRVTTILSDPDSFEIYTRHDCPNEDQAQTNLFVEGPWPSTPTE